MKLVSLLPCLIASVLLIAFDQFTKYLAEINLMGNEPIVLIPGMLELRYLENRGAAFGLLQGGKIFFVIITLFILGVVFYALYRMPGDKRYLLMKALLVLIASGAIGNLIDRLRREYVVDFIYFSLIDFPIFNVADIYVSVATFLLILALLFVYKENEFAFLKPRKRDE